MVSRATSMMFLLPLFAFVSGVALGSSSQTTVIQERVWAFWFGHSNSVPKPMAGARKAAFEHMIKNIGVPVVLVTDDNLGTYAPPSTIHPAFQYLSGVHKSDYLVGYFMHRYGGGFHDIKRETHSFKPYFDVINQDDKIWAIGYQEVSPNDVACNPAAAQRIGIECHAVKENWRHVIGNGMAIFRPRTRLTTAWMNIVHARLTKMHDLLALHPAPFSRCCFEHESGYPLTWNELKGGTIHPLQTFFKLPGRFLQSLPYIDSTRYRSSLENSA